FCNRVQEGGPGVGFGQVQLRDVAHHLRDAFGMSVTRADMINDPQLSVTVPAKYLLFMVENQGKSPSNAMNTYAGMWARPANKLAVRMWLALEEQLVRVLGSNLDKETVLKCLQAGKYVPAEGYDEFWEVVLDGLPGD